MRGNDRDTVAIGLFRSAAVLLILWAAWFLAYRTVGNDYILPSISETLRETGRLLTDGAFWRAFSFTFSRTIFAFVVSFFAAAVFSVVAYTVPSFGRFFAVPLSFLRTLPTLAVILIILVWTTPGKAPVIVAFLALFPMLYAGMCAAFGEIDPQLVEMSKVYRVPTFRRIFRLYIPSAAPYVLKESAAALSFSLKLVVSAEVLANTYQSIGGMMKEAKGFVEMPQLFALTLLTVVTGALLEGLGCLAARSIRRR